MSPLPGSYGVVNTGNNLAARAIRWGTHSDYNHTFIVIEGGKIIEAEPGGAVISDLSRYNGCEVAYNTGEALTDAQRTAVVAKAHSFVGAEYGYTDIGALGLQALGLTWRWLFRLAGVDKDALICSQLVAECGVAAGLTDWLCGKPSPVYVTPGDLGRRPGVQAA